MDGMTSYTPVTGRNTLPETFRLDSRELFRHAKTIEIEHKGKLYTLRVTRLGKLILTA